MCNPVGILQSALIIQKVAVTDWTTAITIILTALAVILAALAIMVGVAAVWGYSTIKDEAIRIARKVATETAEKKLLEYFKNESEVNRLKAMVGTEKPVEPEAGATRTPYTEEVGVNGNPSSD